MLMFFMRILLVSIFIYLGFISPSSSFASHIELNECIEIAHCVKEEWDVSSINQPFLEIKEIIENSPRSNVVEFNEDYLHAEVTSRWMQYIDDLEVSFVPESNKLQMRSESRVGESDLGVNQKRLDRLKSILYK